METLDEHAVRTLLHEAARAPEAPSAVDVDAARRRGSRQIRARRPHIGRERPVLCPICPSYEVTFAPYVVRHAGRPPPCARRVNAWRAGLAVSCLGRRGCWGWGGLSRCSRRRRGSARLTGRRSRVASALRHRALRPVTSRSRGIDTRWARVRLVFRWMSIAVSDRSVPRSRPNPGPCPSLICEPSARMFSTPALDGGGSFPSTVASSRRPCQRVYLDLRTLIPTAPGL